MGIQDILYEELYPNLKGLVTFKYINPEKLPNIERYVGKYRNLRPICLSSAKLKDSPLNNLYVMVPSARHTISLGYQYDYFIELRTYSLETEKDFPLPFYVGTIIEGRLPYTIVAAEVKKGFLKKERVFLPLINKELNRKIAEQIYKSRNEFIELIDQLNSDKEIKSLLKELQAKTEYHQFEKTEKRSHPVPICGAKFKHEEEGFAHLIPFEDKIAITVISTPKPISLERGTREFTKEWLKNIPIGRLSAERDITLWLKGEKMAVDVFDPYEFLLQEKLRLIERIVAIIQNYKYEGPVKTNYIPKGGISDFLNCLRKPVTGREFKVDTSLKPLSKEERMSTLIKSVTKPIIALMQLKLAQERLPFITKLQHSDWRVRRKAASDLGETRDPKAVEPLIQALKDDEWRVRQEAVNALGKIQDSKSIEQLIQALKDEKDEVRKKAAKVLGEIKDPRSLEPLTQAKEDRSRGVRAEAKSALQKIQKVMLKKQEMLQLIENLKHEKVKVRRKAASGLVHFVAVEAVKPLIQALKDEDARVRAAAADALGNIGDPRAIEPLTQATKDKKFWVRTSASVALNKIALKK